MISTRIATVTLKKKSPLDSHSEADRGHASESHVDKFELLIRTFETHPVYTCTDRWCIVSTYDTKDPVTFLCVCVCVHVSVSVCVYFYQEARGFGAAHCGSLRFVDSCNPVVVAWKDAKQTTQLHSDKAQPHIYPIAEYVRKTHKTWRVNQKTKVSISPPLQNKSWYCVVVCAGGGQGLFIHNNLTPLFVAGKNWNLEIFVSQI